MTVSKRLLPCTRLFESSIPYTLTIRSGMSISQPFGICLDFSVINHYRDDSILYRHPSPLVLLEYRPHVENLHPAFRCERLAMRLLKFLPLLLLRFRSEAKMVWALLRDPATPPAAKLVAILGLVYLVSPIDLIPDFVPILGWLDDGVVLAALLAFAYKMLPRGLYESLRAKTGQAGK